DRPHGGRFEPGCDNGVTYLVLQRVAQDFAELFGRLGPEGPPGRAPQVVRGDVEGLPDSLTHFFQPLGELVGHGAADNGHPLPELELALEHLLPGDQLAVVSPPEPLAPLLLGPAALLFSPATLFLGLATAATDEPQDPAGNRTDGAANQPADPRTDRGTRGWLAADALYQPDESVHGSQQCRDALGQRLERVCQGLALLQEHLDAGGPGLLPVAGREPGDELPCSAELPKDGLLDPGAHLLPGRNLLGHVAQGIQGLSGRQGHVARLDQGLPEHPGGLVDLSLGEAAQEEVAALGLLLELGQSTGKFGLAGAAQGVDQLIELRPHAPV